MKTTEKQKRLDPVYLDHFEHNSYTHLSLNRMFPSQELLAKKDFLHCLD